MNRLHLRIVLCCLLLVFHLPLSGQAQSPLSWSTSDGNQYLETADAQLHIKPRTDGTSPSMVTATYKLSLPDTQNWQVSFDIRFGVLEGQGSSLHLTRAGSDIGWMGADGYTKSMGLFIGQDNEVTWTAPDAEWHHISYISNGSTLTAWLDGKQVGSGPTQSAPDSLLLHNQQDMKQPCHQTGVWVRNVQLQSATANSSVASVPSASSSPPNLSKQTQLQKRIDEQNALIASLRKQIGSGKVGGAGKSLRVAKSSPNTRRSVGMLRLAAKQTSLPSVVFFDDFSDSARTSQQWAEKTNEGSISYTGGALQLSGDGRGCPSLTTRKSPLPATGDWTATFAFRFTRIATYGTALGCVDTSGNYVARVLQDATGQYLQINGKNAATRSADTEWHIVSFVKKSATLALYLDGTKAGEDRAPDGPLSLSFGGFHVDSPGAWNNQEVQFVRVDQGKRVFDRTALSSSTPNITVSVEISQVPASSEPTSPSHLIDTVNAYNQLLVQTRALMRHSDMVGVQSHYASACLAANPYADPDLRYAVALSAIHYAQQGIADLDEIRTLLQQALQVYSAIKSDPNLYVYYQNGDYCTTPSYVDADLGMQGAADLRFLVRVR